tara:strand:- start:154 stop:420 length:267 start_codon:yes stop_codon:yes gene_type:complete
MEADIGNPIEFNKDMNDPEQDHQPEQDYYQQQPPMMMMPPQMYQQPPEQPKVDLFAAVDKTTWIVGFVVFLLGFFMGKTMQPVILRHG